MEPDELGLTLPEDPAALERRYRAARAAGDEARFREALADRYQSHPDSVLLQAWHHRLAADASDPPSAVSRNWLPALLLSLGCGIVFWALSEDPLPGFGKEPALLYLWSPVAALFVLAFIALRDAGRRRGALISGGTLALLTFALLSADRLDLRYAEQYRTLLLIHLPLLSWASVGLTLTALPTIASARGEARFAFIRKSLEIFVTAGLYLAAGAAFVGITVGLFEALDVNLPAELLQFMAAGGAGLIPVIAVASVYDPDLEPHRQFLGEGVGRLVPIVTRLLLPLSLIVLAAYLAVIPFNFDAPFQDREVLVVYNVMLFAVTVLLLGVAPVAGESASPDLQRWIRRGVVVLALGAAVVGLYALAAVLTRTVQGGWTLNRITVIGWNLVHIGLLTYMAYATGRAGSRGWTVELRAVFGRGAGVYLVWTLALLALLPTLGTVLK